MESFSLIVPIAADKPLYANEMPYVFRLANDGIMQCIKSVLGLNLEVFDNIYFTILDKHDKQYCLSDLFCLQFKRLKMSNAKIVVLKETRSQADTVYKTIMHEKISGSIFVKDADCSFVCEIDRKNSVAIYPLENLQWVNPQHKSYVQVDDMYYITNIIEKKIVSHYFCAGGYCFEHVEDYCKYYETLQNNDGLFISHIIYSMLLDKNIFRPIIIDEYIDFECV